MKQRMVWAALAALVGAASAAHAEPWRMAQAVPAFLPAYEIVTIVRSAGFDPLSPAARRGEFYVLRAAAPDGREMRVIVDGRRGQIVSSTPVVAAARGGPGERLGPYERMDGTEIPDGYVAPGAPGPSDGPPPVVYEGGRPLIYDRRPMEPIPNAPQRNRSAAIPDASAVPLEPPPIIRAEPGSQEERGEHGLLPPPPERFPSRVAPGAAPKPADRPAAKPAPVKRAAASPPLPKPRPAAVADEAAKSEAPPASWTGAETAPPVPDGKVDARSLPH